MTKTSHGTIRIRWVRSGIAFNRKQAEIVRALGLRRLNHVVERPDNPVVRGLIAKVPHLVHVVEPGRAPAWASVPEYTITSAPGAEEIPVVKKAAAAEEAEPLPEAVATAPEPAESEASAAQAGGDQVEPASELQAAPESAEGKPKHRTRSRKTAGDESDDDANAADDESKD
jgi:large subunit ribosomal protein L30